MSSEVAVKNPLGTERVGKLMVRYAIPSIISIVVNSLYNMVDQIFIGQGVGDKPAPASLFRLALDSDDVLGLNGNCFVLLGDKQPQHGRSDFYWAGGRLPWQCCDKCNFAVDLNFAGSGSADWRRYGVLHKPQSGERKKSRGGLWCRKRHFADSWNQRYFTDTL